MKAHFWLPLILLLGLGGAAQAQPPYGYGPGAYPPGMHRHGPPESPVNQAADVLREGIDKLVAYLGEDDKPNKLQVAAYLDKEIAPYFDFDHMAKWVAGPDFAAMSEEQREAMAATLEARFLSTLATQLANYEGQRVRYFRPRMSHGGAVSVTVGILRPGSYPAKLEFRMYRGAEGWKVYDVVANGRSVSSFYRLDFQRAAASREAASPGR